MPHFTTYSNKRSKEAALCGK